MLKEITNLNDTSDNLKRRWFTDNKLDLYVWVDKDGNIMEFQLSYNKPQDERMIKWTRKNGLSHYRVENGGPDPYKVDASSIMAEATRQNLKDIKNLFSHSGRKLDHDLYEFIISTLTPN